MLDCEARGEDEGVLLAEEKSFSTETESALFFSRCEKNRRRKLIERIKGGGRRHRVAHGCRS
jgi:hypothetical protein